MKKAYLLFVVGLMTSLCNVQTWAQAEDEPLVVHVAECAMPSSAYHTPEVTLEGTGASVTITVSAADLREDVSISATTGFAVSQTSLKAGEETQLTITNTSYRRKNVGKVILRSGDFRAYVKLIGRSSDLESKGELATKVNLTSNEKQTFEGFTPGKNGYTIEFRAKVDDDSKTLEPFAVTSEGVGFKGYITGTGMGLYNGYGSFVSNETLNNPSNGGTFYNTDGQYHTYRYAVTPDERVIVYRDGITVDSMRVADLASQPEWCVANGELKENLIKNAGFEGEYDHKQSVIARIEGWDVYPWDQYNSYQEINSSERSNEVDQNNHHMSLHRYMWNDGWAAGEVSQIVDVAPNETYSFSALAKGGMYSGSPLASIRIYDLQNSDNTQTIKVNGDSWQTYATDFDTKADTRQVRVSFYLERAKWGASVSSFAVDDVKLTGVSREIKQQIGFNNNGADIQYFSFDNTGAYAPLMATITSSADSLEFKATGEKQTVDIAFANLVGDIQVSATNGYSVTPSLIQAGSGSATLTISNDTYRRKHNGKVILRSGDKRLTISLKSHSSDLEAKGELATKVTLGDGEKQTFEGFAPGKNGYTIEFRAKVDDNSKTLEPFAVSSEGVGFKGYVTGTGMGLYNGYNSFVSNETLNNPSNGGTFYNTDGQYHTYRYAVTPDERVIVYRDGITIDSMRVADLASQPEWCVANGELKENLIKNAGFEGEYDHKQSVIARIEGWDVYPWDQYNSYQEINSSERSNEVDQNNHAMSLHRYKWNDGWAAGEVSQIVDVAPNETYSFSALAKGGMYSGSPLASIRIYDLQNSDNTQTIKVNGDSWQTYATDFDTKANTEQIRVSFYLERAKWGASVSSFAVDDVKLTGISREIKQQIGFNNNGADIQYFGFDNTGAYAPLMATLTSNADTLSFNATGEKQTVEVTYANLVDDIRVTATEGYTVTPSIISMGNGTTTLTVTSDTYRRKHSGKVILRSGDKRLTIPLQSRSSNLEAKGDLATKVTLGKGEKQTFEGFAPGKNGYTIEFRAKVDDNSKTLEPFAVSSEGVGFKGYITGTGMGLYNGYGSFVSNETMNNPSNGGTFYNTDGQYHTYRYAVTPDERVIVYRDGITIDSMRVADLASQPEWCVANGELKENLIKNAGFEGEYDHKQSVIARIEGWDVYPWDQYNSYQEINSSERSNEVDQNNHHMSLHRYMWNDGWAAGEVSQIVDVAPNETYSFSALAKGGMYSGSPLASIRIYDLQNSDNTQTIKVNGDSWQTYATDFDTKANTEQIRVSFYLERAKWGASVSSFAVDDVKLTGVSREIKQQIGFNNNGADIQYFSFDNTGAYAPLMATLQPSVDELSLNGYKASETFSVDLANLVGDVTVSATSGFEVSPTVIKAGTKKATVRVTNMTYRRKNAGKVILRSGDKRATVVLTSYGSDLEPKDLSANPVYAGGTDEKITLDGFQPGENGYTIEFSAKVDDNSKTLEPFAVTTDGVGFKGYITGTGMGLYNGYGSFVSNESLSNPSNGGTFYNTDGEYHTYRYAVTPDERVIVYRDGITIDSMRVADLASQPEWCVANGSVKKNLIKNGGFEGEYDHKQSVIARIEGWDVYPWDQYNSYQEINSSERSNEVDQNNHHMSLHRYMWNDGWAAGEVSQIIDVAPNEFYRFSALAKGGMYNGSPLASIRIYDLQNSDNTQTIKVNGDSWTNYATEFETKANTEQIRVSFYLERAKWGASVSSFAVDEVSLRGVSREIKQQVGFNNNGADIKYFTFDNTGAYAPSFPTLQNIDIYTAIESAEAEEQLHIGARTEGNILTLQGVTPESRVLVYSMDGRGVAQKNKYTDGEQIGLPGKGAYIILVTNGKERKSIKIVNK